MFDKKIFSDLTYKKNKLIKLSIFFVFNILLLTACVNKNIYKSNRNKPLVLTTFTILEDLAENISGERLEVKSA